MHSALKHKGRRLYELARRGETVERPPRPVTIHGLVPLEYAPKEARLRVSVRCSKGTYIRSLARDIGQALGCGAHLAGLRRTASAPFDVEDAVTLEALESLSPEQAIALLTPPDRALGHLPSVTLDEQDAARLRQGQRLAGLRSEASGQVRVYGPDQFLGVGEMDGQGRLRPMRLFVAG
jgi:tRNA pseudouridine55 synthase